MEQDAIVGRRSYRTWMASVYALGSMLMRKSSVASTVPGRWIRVHSPCPGMVAQRIAVTSKLFIDIFTRAVSTRSAVESEKSSPRSRCCNERWR